MKIIIELVILCALMWMICYVCVGGDEKNIRSYDNYPDEVKQLLIKDPELCMKIKNKSSGIIFLSNVILFGVILFVFGLFVKEESFSVNFGKLLFLGEMLNLFDLVVIDMLWWRHSPKIRFSCAPQPEIYLDMSNHIQSFKRAILMFIVVALIDAFLITFM